MGVLLLILGAYSANSLACIPCDEDIDVYIAKAEKPIFPKHFYGDKAFGYVKFRIERSITKRIREVSIIDLDPPNLPKESIITMLRNSEYGSTAGIGYGIHCVKEFELELEFPLPQNISKSFKLELPKIEIRQ